MSGIVRPKGGAPPSVYWRRRLILLAAVLLVAAGLVKLLGNGGGDEEPVASSDDQSSTEQPTEQSDEKAKKRKPRHKRDAADAVAGERDVAVSLRSGGACDPASVTMTPSLPPKSYAGDTVPVRLGFTTTSGEPCSLSLDEHAPLISISDGGELVWESTRCDDLFSATRVRLEPGWLTYVDAAWSGRASGRTCGDNADFAPAGEYKVQAAVLGGEPSSATVTLASEPEEDKSDKDKNDKDKNDNGHDDEQSDSEQSSNEPNQDQQQAETEED